MAQSDLDNIAYNKFANGEITLSEYLKYQNRDKIMNYEQKYKEALQRAKECLKDDSIIAKSYVESIFPELKESEDVQSKKWILEYLYDGLRKSDEQFKNDFKTAIAWLEKQGEDKKEINKFDVHPGLYKCVHRMFDGTHEGKLLFELGNVYKCLSKHDRAEFEVSYGHSVYLEDPVVCKHFIPFESKDEQKFANNVEPKFHEGDWVVQGYNILKIKCVGNTHYCFETVGGYVDDMLVSEIDSQFHLWSINDAKDGDILYSLDSKQPFIYKERPQFSQAIGYCCINRFGEFAVWDTNKCVICTDKYIPATKEQRDTLEMAMTNAGYRWDKEKLKLEKL